MPEFRRFALTEEQVAEVNAAMDRVGTHGSPGSHTRLDWESAPVERPRYGTKDFVNACYAELSAFAAKKLEKRGG